MRSTLQERTTDKENSLPPAPACIAPSSTSEAQGPRLRLHFHIVAGTGIEHGHLRDDRSGPPLLFHLLTTNPPLLRSNILAKDAAMLAPPVHASRAACPAISRQLATEEDLKFPITGDLNCLGNNAAAFSTATNAAAVIVLLNLVEIELLDEDVEFDGVKISLLSDEGAQVVEPEELGFEFQLAVHDVVEAGLLGPK